MKIALWFLVLLVGFSGCKNLGSKINDPYWVVVSDDQDSFKDEDVLDDMLDSLDLKELSESAIGALIQPPAVSLIAKNIQSIHLKIELDINCK